MPVRTVALTGATGFVGRPLLAALLASGRRVFALHRRADTAGLPMHERLAWVPFAEADATFARAAPEALVHVATCYAAPRLAEMVEANVALPLRLLEALAAHGGRLLVNTDTFFAKPGVEYPHMPDYIQSKRELARWTALAAARTPGLRVAHLRLEHVYGPDDGPRKFFPALVAKLRAGEAVPLTAGAQRRDFVHVDDVVAAYLAVLDAADTLPPGVAGYEVGTGTAQPLRAFVEAAKDACGSASPLEFGALPYRDGEIMASVADTAALRALGWAPRLDLHVGLRATLAPEAAR